VKLQDLLIGGAILGVLYVVMNPEVVKKVIPPKPTPITKTPPVVGGVGNDKFGVQEIYPTKGATWFSTAWSNGKPRTLKSDQMDPHDSKFGVRRPGNPTVTIDGKGVATVSGTSPRIQVKGTWRNTELTVYVFHTNMRSITLHCRSFEVGGQESAYAAHFEEGGTCWIKKEAGNTYSPRIASKSGFIIPKSTWTGIKQVVKDSGNGVLVESYMDNGAGWKKVTSATDTGEWAGPPALRNGTQCYIRTNDGINTKYRNMSVRSI
jgi:hypothetical protein